MFGASLDLGVWPGSSWAAGPERKPSKQSLWEKHLPGSFLPGSFLRSDFSFFRPRKPISLTATRHARRPGTKTQQAKLVGKMNQKSPGWFCTGLVFANWFLRAQFCGLIAAFFGPEHRFPLLQHIMLAGPERKPSKLSLWEK